MTSLLQRGFHPSMQTGGMLDWLRKNPGLISRIEETDAGLSLAVVCTALIASSMAFGIHNLLQIPFLGLQGAAYAAFSSIQWLTVSLCDGHLVLEAAPAMEFLNIKKDYSRVSLAVWVPITPKRMAEILAEASTAAQSFEIRKIHLSPTGIEVAGDDPISIPLGTEPLLFRSLPACFGAGENDGRTIFQATRLGDIAER